MKLVIERLRGKEKEREGERKIENEGIEGREESICIPFCMSESS